MEESKKIFLIGFMAAGKTTHGKGLSKPMDIPFYDLDKIIEREEKASIVDLFEKIGEYEFRKMEGRYLKEYPFPPSFILATGGGTPCFYDHMQWMNKIGITVYIRLSAKSLSTRLLASEIRDRPLLRNKTEPELVRYIDEKLHEREPFYLQAQYILKGENLKSEDIIREIGDTPELF